MPAILPRISICVCTFRRPELLRQLLHRIAALKTNDLFSLRIVVVDNDDSQSAKPVIEGFRQRSLIPLRYDVEPERSISLARNRSVRNADGEYIAFIDDDEFPEDTWLLNHFQSLLAYKADGVLGPVLPHLNPGAPRWLSRSGLLDRSRFNTGTVLRNYKYTRTGNVLIRRDIFADPDGFFDPKYGKSGGGDAVFFKRMIEKGKLFVWCDEARVYEEVLPERQKRSYYLKRACTRGMTEAWETSVFNMGTLKSLIAVPLYTTALPLLFFAGHHLFMRYLVKNCDHLSKLLGYLGIKLVRERPYTP